MDRLGGLVQSARDHLENGLVWRAYVAVESAILDIKMRHDLELEEPPVPPKRTAKKDDLLVDAKSRLYRLDIAGDKRKLLYDMRACRDALKAALARS